MEKILGFFMQFSSKRRVVVFRRLFFFHRLDFFVLRDPSCSVDVCVSMMQNFISQTDSTVTADAMEYMRITPAVV